jgi:hypothetical protein
MVVEASLSKSLYKLTIGALKVLPMLLAACALLNTVLSYFNLNCDILSHVGGISLLPLMFLYLVSKVFMFCAYHRMFLHYLLVTDSLNIIDFYFGIPISSRTLFGIYIALTGLFLFIILYLYKKTDATNNKETSVRSRQ